MPKPGASGTKTDSLICRQAQVSTTGSRLSLLSLPRSRISAATLLSLRRGGGRRLVHEANICSCSGEIYLSAKWLRNDSSEITAQVTNDTPPLVHFKADKSGIDVIISTTSSDATSASWQFAIPRFGREHRRELGRTRKCRGRCVRREFEDRGETLRRASPKGYEASCRNRLD